MSSVSKNQKIDFLRMSLTLFAITATVGILLALVHFFTKPIVERSAEERLHQSLSALMAEAVDFHEVDEFEKTITLGEVQVPVEAVYTAIDSSNQSIGYCVQVMPNGYFDVIDMMVAIDQEGAVTGVQILSISETPGTGMKVQSDEIFRTSVYGLTDSAKIVKSTPSVKGEIQVISGATATSSAYINGVNAAIEVLQALRLEAQE